MNNRIGVQKGFIFFIIIFIIVNLLFLTIWYKFGVQSSINQGYDELQREVQTDIIENIQRSIDENKKLDVKTLFQKIASKYQLILVVSDENHEVIFNNTRNVTDKEYLTPFVMQINEQNYLISVGKFNTINTVAITKRYMIFEIIFICTITLVALIIANKLLLDPIENTVKDINNYKFGIKPKKRKITNEIYYLQNEFVDMTKSIEKEHEEQNRIISAISHDIKTPLTSIIGYSDLLINKKLKKDEMKALQEKIYNKALNIKEITSDFDDYLTSNSNRTYNYQDVNIKDLLNNLRIEYQDDLKDKSIKLEIVNKARQSTVTIDIGKMHRVFSNIITNSIRHIKNTKGLIRLEITDDNEFFKIKCIDNGVGVPEENLKKIFDPLFTTDKSRKISGLGLSISKEIVEMHGGSIKAYNNKPSGLVIEFMISKKIETNDN